MSTKLPAVRTASPNPSILKKSNSSKQTGAVGAEVVSIVRFRNLKIKEEKEQDGKKSRISDANKRKLEQLAFTGVKKDKLAEKRLITDLTLGDLTVKSFGWLMKRRQVAHRFRDPIKSKAGSMLTMDSVGIDVARFNRVVRAYLKFIPHQLKIPELGSAVCCFGRFPF